MNNCEGSTNKSDHTWKLYDEAKGYLALDKGKVEYIKIVGECEVCGLLLDGTDDDK